MSYEWSNERRLATLEASGAGEILVFGAGTERAEVHLAAGTIAKVVCGSTTVRPDQAKHLVVGEGNWQRDVYHFLKPGGPAPTLRLGITRHRGLGTWSSLPHPFELHPELGFEEVFFYLLEDGPRNGIQVGRGVWHDGSKVDGVWPVRDRTFGTIPMGYHPVVGEPGVQVSYVWAYLAKKQTWEKV